ncbi:MAG: hypothetical protein IKY90_02620 [Oscillospiraceae bacterium]|nr:hypothetical protein [Oscillospiraceae bacterium]
MAKKRQVFRCDRCKREFYEDMFRSCPHPTVKQVFGGRICHYCCMKCKHHTRPLKYCAAIGCGYKSTTEE